MKPRFLNVDLEIESEADPRALAAEWGNAVIVLHFRTEPKTGRHHLALELARHYQSADATIRAFGTLIDTLSPTSRTLWNGANKEVDIGYELRTSESAIRFTLQPTTIKRVADLEACLTVTCYRE
jgi:hypothetical protein